MRRSRRNRSWPFKTGRRANGSTNSPAAICRCGLSRAASSAPSAPRSSRGPWRSWLVDHRRIRSSDNMFVLRSTYLQLMRDYFELELKMLQILLREKKPAKPIFNEKELKQLVALCHPDKHGGSKVAEEMTRKLLALRTNEKAKT